MIYSESLYSDVSFLILERIEPLFHFIGLLEIAVCALSLALYYWVKFGAPWKC